jgi:ubiquinone/menaquinone biosynthesis C-methylase UbiE
LNRIVSGYDAGAAEYARHWAPVLRETAARLIAEIERNYRPVAGRPMRVLDVGAGTGTLAITAARRWPEAEIVASDAAAGMMGFAQGRAEEEGVLPGAKLSFAVGLADELPFPNASFDVCVSSFVLQLVPDRLAALSEIRRVLRPGGLFAYVTWLDRESRERFAAGEEFDEAVYELNVEEPDDSDDSIAGDVHSPRSAADELRRAGFVRASAREETLSYEWSMESYLDYKFQYDERSLLSVLDSEQRAQLERNVRERLARLDQSGFRWEAPVVFARGFAPG